MEIVKRSQKYTTLNNLAAASGSITKLSCKISWQHSSKFNPPEPSLSALLKSNFNQLKWEHDSVNKLITVCLTRQSNDLLSVIVSNRQKINSKSLTLDRIVSFQLNEQWRSKIVILWPKWWLSVGRRQLDPSFCWLPRGWWRSNSFRSEEVVVADLWPVSFQISVQLG